MSDAAWPSSPSFHYNTLHNKVLHSTCQWPLDGFSDPDFELSSDSEPTPEDGTTLTQDDDVRTPVFMIDPRGFCGQSLAGHLVKLVKQKRTLQPQSSCPQAIAFSLGAAANSSKASPSTNAPFRCQLCPVPSSGDRAVFWKYNVHQHITSSHDTSYESLPAGFAKEIEISQLEKEHLGIPPDLIDNSVQDDSNATTVASTSQNSLTKRRRQTLQGNTGSKHSKKV